MFNFNLTSYSAEYPYSTLKVQIPSFILLIDAVKKIESSCHDDDIASYI